MKLFGLKNCDKCRQAFKDLRNFGHDITLIDVRSDGISLNLLENLYKIFGDNLVNKRSTTWRGLSETEKKENSIKLITQYPALMKRPIIFYNNKYEMGWNKEVEGRIPNFTNNILD